MLPFLPVFPFCQFRFESNRNIVQLNTVMTAKLGYIIDVLEGKARANDPSRRLQFDDAATSSAGPSSSSEVVAVDEMDEEEHETPATAPRGRRGNGKSVRRA